MDIVHLRSQAKRCQAAKRKTTAHFNISDVLLYIHRPCAVGERGREYGIVGCKRRGSSRRLVEETCGSSGSEVIRNGLPRFKGYITVRWSGMFLLDFCIELHGSKMVMEPFREALNCLARAQRENSVGSSVRRRCMRLLYQIPPQPPGEEGVCVCVS